MNRARKYWPRALCGLFAVLCVSAGAEAARVFVERQKIVAPAPAERARFGTSVAVSGDTAVIGVPAEDPNGRSEGAAYVYVLTDGVWTFQARLMADDSWSFRRFGWAVAVYGDTVLVGAPGHDYDGGAVYCFNRTGTVWSLQTRLESVDRSPGQRFGSAVALHEDTAVIGAPSDWASTGAAYVFVRTNGVFVQEARLVAPDGVQRDEFGTSVGVHGGTAIVGAPRVSGASGAVYAFARTEQGWVFETYLRAPLAVNSDWFGHSVAIDAGTALIGAPYRNPNGFGAGSIVTFDREGGAWPAGVRHGASDGRRRDVFGIKVAIDGQNLVAGAMFEDADESGDMDETGAAYSFTRSGGAWHEQAKLVASDAAEFDVLGSAVAIVGHTALVGAPDSDAPGGVYDAGAVYVFQVGPVHDVQIDLKPESFPNVVNLSNRGALTVAILGSVDFAAELVDLSTVRFGPHRASPMHDGLVAPAALEDVNLDGHPDRVAQFRTRDVGLDCESETLALTGRTLGGELFHALDSIVIVGCRRFYLPASIPDERTIETNPRHRVNIEAK